MLLAAQTTEPGTIEGFLALPVHPIFVHFPIALLTIAAVLVYLRHGRGREDLETFIMPSLTTGVAIMPFVFLAGLRDAGWLDLWRDRAWDQPLLWHAISGTLTIILFVTYFAIRRTWVQQNYVRPKPDLYFSTAGLWLLLMTGLIAGEMVYA